jgi:hypothetical protein
LNIDPKSCGIGKNEFDLYLPGIGSSEGKENMLTDKIIFINKLFFDLDDAIDDIYRFTFNDEIPQPCGKLARK